MVTKFALIFGIIYAIIGVLGFIPGLVTPPEMTGGMTNEMAVEMGHGRLFGLFAVNFLHNLVHLGVGVWGIMASRQGLSASVFFAQVNAVLFAILALLGLIPFTNTLFGLVPLYGHDVWLHILTALAAGYFGFGPPARPVTETKRAPR
ncbi:DUF4383 domain-containing protein [Halomonas sediminis]|uniref:DUF4383 domain-containing protein n=1 Tax=Vreelandella zhuhanensis TaxID=2684210 RepID=A0A7X3KQA5_9GAMM|nr:DUF4383 domain-containing protein [Halomonas zhuhanensis]MWJ27121.1 DUF4383 domain-containing protein [Halomonas zhuhanensis]